MIVYLDASALVKRYVLEAGTAEVAALVERAELAGTAVISRAEVSAAISRAVRMGFVDGAEAAAALRLFRAQWATLFRLKVDESVVGSAGLLAWGYRLRGYDAVHLACALEWQDLLGEPMTLATYGRELWDAARGAGLSVWPVPLE